VQTYYSEVIGRYKEWWQVPAYTYAVSGDLWSTLFTEAYNQAYNRLIQQLKADQAELGAALAERKQSMEMIASRSLQLLNFARRLRRLDFVGAGKALGLTRSQLPKGVRGNAKSFANNFLEYSFGWAPLASDIGNAVDTLQRGVPPAMVRSRGRKNYNFSSFSPNPSGGDLTSLTGWMKVQLGCQVQVDNPNLFLANQLGFVNPAAIAWEIVPFSFVVDYFFNVQSFLNSFTDLWGLDIKLPYRTKRLHIDSYDTHSSPTSPLEQYAGKYDVIERAPGPFSGPTLKLKEPWQISPTRALTSISLLVQALK